MDLQLSVYHKLISMKDKTMKMHHWLGIAVTGVLIAIGSITTVSALPIPPSLPPPARCPQLPPNQPKQVPRPPASLPQPWYQTSLLIVPPVKSTMSIRL